MITETATRPYLLEQIDDAAVVQLYADGFDKLSLVEKTLVCTSIRPPLPGATSITTSATAIT